MPRWSILLALCGCVTFANGNRGVPLVESASVFTRETSPRYADPPRPVVHDANAVEKKLPVVDGPATTDRAHAIGGQLGIMVILAKYLITGIDFEAGTVRSTATSAASTDSSIYMGLSAVAGLTGRVGRISATADLAAGLRKLERHSEGYKWFYSESRGALESRLRVDVGLRPWLTLGVFGGIDQMGARRLGLGIAIHLPGEGR
jgi:hypothetical protein